MDTPSDDTRRYYRVLDVNLNRCREGLRVIEDTARFVLGRDDDYRAARQLRHRLDALTRTVYPELVGQRDAEADAGRTVAEGAREDLRGVLAANFRRAEEAARVLEEYSRLLLPEAGPALKEIRYSLYSLEKNILA